MRNLRSVARLVLFLALVYGLIIYYNEFQGGILTSFGRRPDVILALIIISLTVAGLVLGKILKTVQSLGVLTLVDSAVIIGFLSIATYTIGIDCGLAVCLPSLGSRDFIPRLSQLTTLALPLVLGVLSEEFFFRGYVINELRIKGWKLKSILCSGILFGAAHVPVYFGNFTTWNSNVFLNLVTVGSAGIIYGIAYWCAERNLFVPIILHTYSNLLAPALKFPTVMQITLYDKIFGSTWYLIMFALLPTLFTILIHWLFEGILKEYPVTAPIPTKKN